MGERKFSRLLFREIKHSVLITKSQLREVLLRALSISDTQRGGVFAEFLFVGDDDN